jgi:uncharacterized protein YciW
MSMADQDGAAPETGAIEWAAGAAAAVAAPRADLLRMAARAEQAIMAPRDPGGLEPGLRAALACRIARHNGDERLAERFLRLAGADAGVASLADPKASAPPDPRLRAIVRHVDLVTREPKAASSADVEALQAAGVAVDDVVRLSQLVAFVNFQARVAQGLRLIGGAA